MEYSLAAPYFIANHQRGDSIADSASSLSRQAGVVAATATTVTTVAPPLVKPISGAVAVVATVIRVGAAAVEQLVRPDMGQTGVNAAGAAVSEIINKRVPVLAPITNEIAEAAKASYVSKSVQEKLNAGTDLGK